MQQQQLMALPSGATLDYIFSKCNVWPYSGLKMPILFHENYISSGVFHLQIFRIKLPEKSSKGQVWNKNSCKPKCKVWPRGRKTRNVSKSIGETIFCGTTQEILIIKGHLCFWPPLATKGKLQSARSGAHKDCWFLTLLCRQRNYVKI